MRRQSDTEICFTKQLAEKTEPNRLLGKNKSLTESCKANVDYSKADSRLPPIEPSDL